MSVAAVTQPNPSNLFQTPVSTAAGTQRLDTKVSAITAAADLTGRLSVTTAGGDKITLTADFEARFQALNYQGQIQTDAGTAQVSAKSIEASLSKQYGVTVEGDLNEQELNDLEKLFRKVSGIFNKYFRGQDDEALAKTAKLADKFGGLSSLSSLDLSVSIERSVTVVAAQIASDVTGRPAVPANSATPSAVEATPGAASSTAAAIPPSSTGTTAPTQPSTDAAASAADSTVHLVAPAPDASQPKSLVQQVLDALEETRVESQKVRKYLPDFLKRLREDLSKELSGDRAQNPQASPAGQPDAPAAAPATPAVGQPESPSGTPASTVSSLVFAYQSVRQTSFSLSIRS